MAINFILKCTKKTAQENKPTTIYLRLTAGVSKTELTKNDKPKKIEAVCATPYRIRPKDWSTSKQQPKSLKEDHFKRLNSDLFELKSDLLKHLNSCKGQVMINTTWLKEFLYPSAEPVTLPTSLVAYFDTYIESKRKMVSPNSLKKYNVIKAKLKKYEQEHKTTISIRDICPAFQASFEKFCIKHNYAHNTIAMELRFIKTVCRHAATQGLEINSKLESIQNIKYEPVDSIYLNLEDIEKIKAVNGLSPYLDNARDWLLISCYTGARVSDFLRFNKSMLRQEQSRNGKLITLIEFEQKKTGKQLPLPIAPEVLKILEKRGGEFPHKISDQRYNEYIKEVCKAAEINELVAGSKKVEIGKNTGIYRKEAGTFEKWELVSSHIGRRSFATNNYGRIPTSLLIAATGHSTEILLHKYLKKNPTDRALELAEYF